MKNNKSKTQTKAIKINHCHLPVINSNYCKLCINDYDDPQMCIFCKKGSHQTLGQ